MGHPTSFTALALTNLASNSLHNFPTYYSDSTTVDSLSEALTHAGQHPPKKYRMHIRSMTQAPQMVIRVAESLFITTVLAPLGILTHLLVVSCRVVKMALLILSQGRASPAALHEKRLIQAHCRAAAIDFISIISTLSIALHFGLDPHTAALQFHEKRFVRPLSIQLELKKYFGLHIPHGAPIPAADWTELEELQQEKPKHFQMMKLLKQRILTNSPQLNVLHTPSTRPTPKVEDEYAYHEVLLFLEKVVKQIEQGGGDTPLPKVNSRTGHLSDTTRGSLYNGFFKELYLALSSTSPETHAAALREALTRLSNRSQLVFLADLVHSHVLQAESFQESVWTGAFLAPYTYVKQLLA